MAPKQLTNATDCNVMAVRQAARYMTQFYDRYLDPTGLRTTQFGILGKLKRKGSMSINTLAAELVMDRTTLGRNVQPLERDGLVAVEQDPSDGRSKLVQLTKAGEKRFQQALKAWASAQNHFERAYGREEASDLRDMLRTVVATDLGPKDAVAAE